MLNRSQDGAAARAESRADEAELVAEAAAARCWQLLRPLLRELDARLDVRLVRTLANAVVALVRHRNRPQALLLSELGAYLAGPRHAPAGTKRLASLLHSPRWQATRIAAYLLDRGRAVVAAEAARVAEGRALCILDGSVLEKPESVQAEGLVPIRSSKARRLARPRPKQGAGYYRGKPGGPIVVPGWSWLAVLATGWAAPSQGRPLALGAWHWFSQPPAAAAAEAPAGTGADAAGRPALRGEQVAAWEVLERVVAAWGAERLLHVWDRGLSGAPWLGAVLDRRWHFVVRWKKGNRLRPASAPSVGDPTAPPDQQDREGIPAWRLTGGLRAWGRGHLVSPRTPHRPLVVSFAARPVRLLHRDEPVWLVVARIGKGTKRRRGSPEPWRLLTTEPVETPDQCWRIIEAYAARWLVEQTLRFGKADLGLESVRVRAREPRHKLLGLVALAYACLIELLATSSSAFLQRVLRWAHRSGRQAREAWRPLHRLRLALAALWQQHTPTFQGVP